MKNENPNRENGAVMRWFRTHKKELETLQRVNPQNPVVILLNRIITYHAQTGIWPTLRPETWQMLRKVFNDVPPFKLQR